jgi:hypothetical protein
VGSAAVWFSLMIVDRERLYSRSLARIWAFPFSLLRSPLIMSSLGCQPAFTSGLMDFMPDKLEKQSSWAQVFFLSLFFYARSSQSIV